MYRFDLIDAYILLGLFGADKAANESANISCLEVVASCKAINDTIPELAEFATAFNKFLYARVISLDENKLSLTSFGRQLVNGVKNNGAVAVAPDELARQLSVVLAGYKLKSMCNRSIWTQQDYQQAVAAQQNNSPQ